MAGHRRRSVNHSTMPGMCGSKSPGYEKFKTPAGASLRFSKSWVTPPGTRTNAPLGGVDPAISDEDSHRPLQDVEDVVSPSGTWAPGRRRVRLPTTSSEIEIAVTGLGADMHALDAAPIVAQLVDCVTVDATRYSVSAAVDRVDHERRLRRPADAHDVSSSAPGHTGGRPPAAASCIATTAGSRRKSRTRGLSFLEPPRR